MGTTRSLSARALAWAKAGSAAVLGHALVVLSGWFFDRPFLAASAFGVTMHTNAAVALACGGLANLLLLSARHRRGWVWAAHCLAGVSLLIGGVTLAEHLVGWDLGIDELLAREAAGAVATNSPNRMGPPASTACLLIGIALLLADSSHRRRQARGLAAALASGTIAIVPLVGYAFGLTALFSVAGVTGIAVSTAVALLVLSVSVIAGRPTSGLAGLLCREDESGAMARQLGGAAILLPFAVGWLLARTFDAGLINGAFAISTMTLVLIVGLIMLIWRAGAELGRALDQRLAVERALLDTARSLREADVQKTAFLATLSHELRNPLAPIRFALEMLDGPPQTAQRARKTITRQVDHLVRLVDDLLDLTRITHNKLQLHRRDVDVSQLVDDAVDAVAQEIAKAQHQLEVALPSQPLWVNADPDRVVQILSNLLINAARYTAPGGRITVGAAAENGQAVFFVRDNGAGLSAADVSRVFDMFVQVGEAGHGGLGIGLALVKGLVQLHGGTVEAHSEGPLRGAEFRVRLPRVDEPSERRAPGPGATSRERPCRILVVDDNADAADTLRDILQARGHDVEVAYDAADALAIADGWPPDVGLLDLGLPGVSGLALVEQLRRQPATADMLLIAITGWGQDADRRRALVAGFNAHLTKPADLDALVALIAARYPAVAPSHTAPATVSGPE